jgi:hypothetical protein
MDRSRGASVEDVGQEESKRGLYRKIAGRYVGSVKTKARELNLILSRRLKKSEEMSAPWPPWTPEEDGLLRSMGAPGESAPRLQRCSSAKRRGCTSVLTYSRSSWPVRRQGRSRSGNDQSRHQITGFNEQYHQRKPARRTGTAKAITLPRQGRFPQD